jgi:hypothetical protein
MEENKLTEAESHFYRLLDTLQSCTSLFTLEEHERVQYKLITLQILEFVENCLSRIPREVAVSVKVYNILFEIDRRLKLSQLFGSNALNVILYYNLGFCHQNTPSGPQMALGFVTNSIIEFEMLSKTSTPSCGNPLEVDLFFCRGYLQTAALFCVERQHEKSLKLAQSAIDLTLRCIDRFEREIQIHLGDSPDALGRYQRFCEELRSFHDLVKCGENSANFHVQKSNTSKFLYWKHVPENNKKMISAIFRPSIENDNKLTAPWLKDMSLSDFMFLSILRHTLFEPKDEVSLSEINEWAIKLAICLASGYFTIATEKRFLAIKECESKTSTSTDDLDASKTFSSNKILAELKKNESLKSNKVYINR